MLMNFWNKKIKQNLFIGLGVWIVFGVFALTGWFSGWQESFNGLIYKQAAAVAAEPTSWILLSLFFEDLILVMLINNIRPAYSLVAPFSLMMLYYGAFRIFLNFGMRLDLFYAFFLGMAVYLINIVYNFLSFDAERKKIRRAFEFYLAPQYVEEVSANPEKLKLGGETKELTVYFSDIRAFSSIAEKMSAADLVSFLNEYFTALTNIITENKGVVDKYIGDAVMAFWGSPLADPNHPVNAVKSAWEILSKLKELNAGWIAKGLPEIKMGIGISTGEMVVGNIGSESRFNDTVIGDEVNLASRLEGLTKYYGARIIVSQNTWDKVKNDFCGRLLDLAAVKGKEKPIKIYEILGLKKGEAGFKELIDLGERALSAYFEKKWEEATDHFKKLNQIDQNKMFSALFIERCRKFSNEPPPADWQGAWQMTEK